MDKEDIKNNAWAFPFALNALGLASPGMPMRDYFAAKALPVAMDRLYDFSKRQGKGIEGGISKIAAEFAYEVADCMMAAREAKS